VPQILTNSSAAGASAPVVWGGGNGTFEASGTFNGATLTLQSKNGDGSFSDVAGTALTAAGKAQFSLTPAARQPASQPRPGAGAARPKAAVPVARPPLPAQRTIRRPSCRRKKPRSR
jgi:hypothetical protein